MADQPIAEDLQLEPIRLSAVVKRPVTEAFRLFTEAIGEWWPLREGFSYGGDLAKEIYIEAFVGGRFYERFATGEEFDVGRVVTCEPPSRIIFTWHGGWSADTEVEVRFSPLGSQTRVDVEHRGWERLGDAGQRLRTNWLNGWPTVLGRYAQAASNT